MSSLNKMQDLKLCYSEDKQFTVLESTHDRKCYRLCECQQNQDSWGYLTTNVTTIAKFFDGLAYTYCGILSNINFVYMFNQYDYGNVFRKRLAFTMQSH